MFALGGAVAGLRDRLHPGARAASLTQKLVELSTTAEPSALTRNEYWPVVFVMRRP